MRAVVSRLIAATAWLASPLGTKPSCRINEAILKQASAIRRACSVSRVREMIEAVTVVLGLLCVGIFLAHAIDAYRTL
jgi:hypothetical protein